VRTTRYVPARRWEGEASITRYHLPNGFVVELSYDTQANELTRLWSFRSVGQRENYLLSIQLTGDL
jgi:hypothetical protein